MLGLVAIMGTYTAAIGYVAARWAPARGALRWLFLLPALWVFAEWIRGWFLSGFPWLALGYSQLASDVCCTISKSTMLITNFKLAIKSS
jgi:apolipoprotein N-acyltransferase